MDLDHNTMVTDHSSMDSSIIPWFWSGHEGFGADMMVSGRNLMVPEHSSMDLEQT